jgi:cytosine/adenosine deaminase-related metal-dependent hydrolase
MITRQSANALLFPQCGTLEPGKAADFVVLDMPRGTADPLCRLFWEDIPVRTVFCDGRLASGKLPD